MGILTRFLSKREQPLQMNVRDNVIECNGVVLSFPASQEEVAAAVGELEYVAHWSSAGAAYLSHRYGLVFHCCDAQGVSLKSRKAFRDAAHNIVSVHLYCAQPVQPMLHETALPKCACKAEVTVCGKSVSQIGFVSDRATVGDFSATLWTNRGEQAFAETGELTVNFSLSFNPLRPACVQSYALPDCAEEGLAFDSFAFKLAVVQVLMYELALLPPRFDVYEFAEQYKGNPFDTETEKPIKAVVNYFKKLTVPKRLAENVTVIRMDGGNEIYQNIAPDWDGEDDTFDLDAVADWEIAQFPNLKSITLMSGRLAEVEKVFAAAGVQVEMIE